jgi:hypothetical protein
MKPQTSLFLLALLAAVPARSETTPSFKFKSGQDAGPAVEGKAVAGAPGAPGAPAALSRPWTLEEAKTAFYAPGLQSRLIGSGVGVKQASGLWKLVSYAGKPEKHDSLELSEKGYRYAGDARWSAFSKGEKGQQVLHDQRSSGNSLGRHYYESVTRCGLDAAEKELLCDITYTESEMTFAEPDVLGPGASSTKIKEGAMAIGYARYERAQAP